MKHGRKSLLHALQAETESSRNLSRPNGNSETMQQHQPNNFDFVRLLAASMVLCSHQFALTGRPEPRPFNLINLGTLGVLIFFSVSGYLVAQSWDRDPHILRFTAKRLLRVWPGLAVVTCLAALLLGPAITQQPMHDYFRSPITWDYFSQLYFSTRLYLPGVFDHNTWHVVNGSLWTIPIEMRWYGILLVAGLCGLLRKRVRFLLLGMVLIYAVYIYGVYDVQHNPRAKFPFSDVGIEFGSFFAQGVVLYHFRDSWQRHPLLLPGALGLSAAVLIGLDHGYAALYLVLPMLVIWFGNSSMPVLRRCGRFGDFSYGIYIYAFLVQQLLVYAMGPNLPYWLGVVISATCTLVCAVLSWHLVERPALDLKYRLSGARRAADDQSDALSVPQPFVHTATDHPGVVVYTDRQS